MSTSLTLFTIFHSLISLVAIIAGSIVVYKFFKPKDCPCSTKTYFITAILTSVTGFGFPANRLLPAHKIGIISLLLLGAALFAKRKIGGLWEKIYATTTISSLYLLYFVLIFQAFEKVLFLENLAPTRTEPPFKLTQIVTLIIFVILGTVAVKKFKPTRVM